ncbi:uncharacterized protein LTR77_010744 [Saxophila tyrrhenica]|uniref:Amino acid transporter n=1 Tax=Saxophila tyrrhenica TaxID=1690608 RepID=A0AAV9NUR5_9PEZI|nr:hypothetical protein LTR77_010744 [Saxophila tyrrhenica]
MGWQVYLAGLCFMVCSVIQGLIVLNNLERYVYRSWHETLITIAVILFVVLFNTLLARRLPLIEGLLLIVHIGGLLAIIIPLWVLAPRGTAHETLFNFTTTGGWDNLGLAALIGMVNPIGVLVGYDSAVHMSEEVHDASFILPQALIWSVVPNGVMALVMGVTFVFCIGDIDDVLASPTYEPFVQAFFNATQSYAGTTVMAFIILFMLTAACISEVATASRQLWSFARDNRLPFSAWLSQVTPGWNIPLHTRHLRLGRHQLASVVNQYRVLRRAQRHQFPRHAVVALLLHRDDQLSGKYGLAINIVSPCFVLPLLFFATWPLATPVTAAGFNWSSVMFVSILLIALVYYVLYARHVYTGPVVLVKRED